MEPSIFDWIYDLRISIIIAEGTWQFPLLEVIHNLQHDLSDHGSRVV